MSDEGKKIFGIKPLWVAVSALVIVAGAACAWFTLGKGGIAHRGGAGSSQSASAEASPGGTCGTALARVRDYGVVPYNAELSGNPAGSKSDDGHIACAAASGDQTYSMLVTLSCDDLSDAKCLEIYRVTKGDGNALFQKRPYSF